MNALLCLEIAVNAVFPMALWLRACHIWSGLYQAGFLIEEDRWGSESCRLWFTWRQQMPLLRILLQGQVSGAQLVSVSWRPVWNAFSLVANFQRKLQNPDAASHSNWMCAPGPGIMGNVLHPEVTAGGGQLINRAVVLFYIQPNWLWELGVGWKEYQLTAPFLFIWEKFEDEGWKNEFYMGFFVFRILLLCYNKDSRMCWVGVPKVLKKNLVCHASLSCPQYSPKTHPPPWLGKGPCGPPDVVGLQLP